MTNDFDLRKFIIENRIKEAQFDAKKSDLDRDGKLSSYEKKRGVAIAKNIKEAVPFKKNALDESASDLVDQLQTLIQNNPEVASMPLTALVTWLGTVGGLAVADKISPLKKADNIVVPKQNKLKEQPARLHHDATDLEESHWKQEDDESSMAHSQLRHILELAQKLNHLIEENDQLDAWVQAKLTKSEDYLDSVYHYLRGEEEEHEDEDHDEEDHDRGVSIISMAPINQI